MLSHFLFIEFRLQLFEKSEDKKDKKVAIIIDLREENSVKNPQRKLFLSLLNFTVNNDNVNVTVSFYEAISNLFISFPLSMLVGIYF